MTTSKLPIFKPGNNGGLRYTSNCTFNSLHGVIRCSHTDQAFQLPGEHPKMEKYFLLRISARGKRAPVLRETIRGVWEAAYCCGICLFFNDLSAGTISLTGATEESRSAGPGRPRIGPVPIHTARLSRTHCLLRGGGPKGPPGTRSGPSHPESLQSRPRLQRSGPPPPRSPCPVAPLPWMPVWWDMAAAAGSRLRRRVRQRHRPADPGSSGSACASSARDSPPRPQHQSLSPTGIGPAHDPAPCPFTGYSQRRQSLRLARLWSRLSRRWPRLTLPDLCC